MNRLEEINRFNKKIIKAYDKYKKELDSIKEKLIEAFLEENKISKTDFINMRFEKAYSYLLERYKDVQIFENFNRKTLLVSNTLITYKDERWCDFNIYGVLDFNLYESEYSDLESFIDTYRDNQER